MTRVELIPSEKTGYRRLVTEGHSGYAEEGSDIVCASVSAATELVMTLLETFSVQTETVIEEKRARVEVNILQTDGNAALREDIRRVLDGYGTYIRNVSEAYPKNVTCIITKEGTQKCLD